jgi:hypothetical protein
LKVAVGKIRLQFARDLALLTAAALEEVSKLVQDHR